jgi:glycosyltransferase involved in cell wall biosynthesis
MRVVLSTISEFHVYHVARQLERLKLLSHLFTGQPRWKLRRKQLPLDKVTTFPYFQTLFEALSRMNVTVHPFSTDLNWQCHRTFDQHVARQLPECDIFDALSYNGLKSGITAQQRNARWICRAANSHLIFQDEILREEYRLLGLPFRGQDGRFLAYAEESYHRADMIIVPSGFARQTFISKGIPAQKVALVPFGANMLGADKPVEPRMADGLFRVLYVGQMSVRKGIHYLLRAFKLANLPASRLTLVGALLPESEPLLREASSDTVEVLGPQPKHSLPEYYMQADVLVLASIEEGLAGVIREALAYGCPVIASANTGGRDLFTDGVEGFEVPIRSPEAIAEKLVWLYEHPQERIAMRQAALQRVRSIRGWDTYGEQLVEVYRQTLGSP